MRGDVIEDEDTKYDRKMGVISIKDLAVATLVQ